MGVGFQYVLLQIDLMPLLPQGVKHLHRQSVCVPRGLLEHGVNPVLERSQNPVIGLGGGGAAV